VVNPPAYGQWERLRAALQQAAVREHGTVVIDMSCTRFCDTAGIHALVAAHKRARAEGGQVLLVIGGAAVPVSFRSPDSTA
jgi:hypothetical protein